MQKGESKDAVVILNRYTLEKVARYPGAVAAAEDLGLKVQSIRRAICGHVCVYDCYWVYEKELPSWMPRKMCFKRVNGNKSSEKLRRLLGQD